MKLGKGVNELREMLHFTLICKLNMQIQISLIIGNLYSADPVTGISSIRKINE